MSINCRAEPCLGHSHSHRSAMRGQLESLHNHWDPAWPQLPWGTTDASGGTKPQQYSKVSTCKGCSFNLPFPPPICASVEEPGADLHVLLSNPEHLTLRKEKNKQALLADKRQQRHPTASQDPGIPSVLTQGSDRVHVCICQCVDRVGWSSRASWDGSFTRSETMTNLTVAFYKTLRNMTWLYNYRLVFRLCSQSSDGQLKRQIVGLTTRKTLAARVVPEEKKKQCCINIHHPSAFAAALPQPSISLWHG